VGSYEPASFTFHAIEGVEPVHRFCSKLGRHSTGCPCVGRSGTIVSAGTTTQCFQVSARTLEAPSLTSTPSALGIVPIFKVSALPRIVNRCSGARHRIQGQVMRKECSFAADQPTIHLLFGSSAIKEINAYVPKKATMAIVGILIIGLSRRPFNRP
jgi:hypothetical protein